MCNWGYRIPLSKKYSVEKPLNHFALFSRSCKQSFETEGPSWVHRKDDLDLLPTMQTDISVEAGERRVIIETKYYRETLAEYHGAEKLHAGNLYQLFSYVMNAQHDARSVGRHTLVSDG